MNKKEAIAYAQIALDCMNKTNNTDLSLADLGMNMKSAFRMYDRSMILIIADSKVYAEKKLKFLGNKFEKNGNDIGTEEMS